MLSFMQTDIFLSMSDVRFVLYYQKLTPEGGRIISQSDYPVHVIGPREVIKGPGYFLCSYRTTY